VTIVKFILTHVAIVIIIGGCWWFDTNRRIKPEEKNLLALEE